MSKTLLEIVAAASTELAQSVPTDVISATDNYTIQMRGLLAQVCEEHVRSFDWQALMVTRSFTTVPGQDRYDLPADHLRIMNNTMIDVTNRRVIPGPSTSSQWSRLTGLQAPAGVTTRYRIQGNQIVLSPTPTATVNITYEYKSAFYCWDSGSHLPKAGFTSNSDTVAFDDRLMVNALKLKFLATKGFSTQAAQVDYNASKEAAESADVGGGTLDLAGTCDDFAFNIPDSGYGL